MRYSIIQHNIINIYSNLYPYSIQKCQKWNVNNLDCVAIFANTDDQKWVDAEHQFGIISAVSQTSIELIETVALYCQ